MTLCGAVLNPAIGFASMLVMGKVGLAYIWLYSAVPFGGAILALIFHEFVFKKTQEVLNEDIPAEDDPDSLIEK